MTGDKIVIVSHSQGNLYANEVCLALKKDETISEYLKIPYPFINIQVASPASIINCGSKYHTLVEDKVINGVYTQASVLNVSGVNKPMPAFDHFSEGFISPDSFNHSFLDVYLGDPILSNKIYNDISNETNRFSFHGRNLPISSYWVSSDCVLSKYTDKTNENKILCKDATEGISPIKLSKCSTYVLVGTFSDKSERVEKTISRNLASIKTVYDQDKGFKTTLIHPKEESKPESFWDIWKAIFTAIMSIAVIGGFGYRSKF